MTERFSHLVAFLKRGSTTVLFLFIAWLDLSGCAIHTEPNLSVIRNESPESGTRMPRDLFVFLDGTANSGLAKDAGVATNVWKMYQVVKSGAIDSSKTFYVEGVGTARNPVTGMILGKGMEKRIKLGYEFLARNYRRGDKIYIFGFSRGAHQARALAGLISYAGLPMGIDSKTTSTRSKVNAIIEVVKDRTDEELLPKWAVWTEGSLPLLSSEIGETVGLEMQPAEVELLGLWDTVPGSMLKRFGECAELPNKKGGDRYKSASYPTIRQIAHAISRDEKRSRFGLLRACSAIDSTKTDVQEMWFPGAHSDVGGGYDDSKRGVVGPSLSNAPLNWMAAILAQHGALQVAPAALPEDPAALAHWPVGSRLFKAIGTCKERAQPEEHLKHQSVRDREALAVAPILNRDEIVKRRYPATCADLD